MPKGVYKRKPRRSKRDDILDAATRVYAHHGFEGATMERMAEEAGVSRSLIREHFGGKQELVRAIADRAVLGLLEWIRGIGDEPGLTLGCRERLIHRQIKEKREEWCLVLGTILVPSFQFQAREEVAAFLEANLQTVLERRAELRTPTEESARAYAYTAASLHIGFLAGGREEEYQNAMERHMELYLLPEREAGEENRVDVST